MTVDIITTLQLTDMHLMRLLQLQRVPSTVTLFAAGMEVVLNLRVPAFAVPGTVSIYIYVTEDFYDDLGRKYR